MGSELESGSSFNKCESGPPSRGAAEEGEPVLFISMPVLILASDGGPWNWKTCGCDDCCCGSDDGCSCDGCSCLRLYALIILLIDPWDTFIPCPLRTRVIWFLP